MLVSKGRLQLRRTRRLPSEYYPLTSFYILQRWGREVFQSQDEVAWCIDVSQHISAPVLTASTNPSVPASPHHYGAPRAPGWGQPMPLHVYGRPDSVGYTRDAINSMGGWHEQERELSTSVLSPPFCTSSAPRLRVWLSWSLAEVFREDCES